MTLRSILGVTLIVQLMSCCNQRRRSHPLDQLK